MSLQACSEYFLLHGSSTQIGNGYCSSSHATGVLRMGARERQKRKKNGGEVRRRDKGKWKRGIEILPGESIYFLQ